MRGERDRNFTQSKPKIPEQKEGENPKLLLQPLASIDSHLAARTREKEKEVRRRKKKKKTFFVKIKKGKTFKVSVFRSSNFLVNHQINYRL
jgi:hypothetical protein